MKLFSKKSRRVVFRLGQGNRPLLIRRLRRVPLCDAGFLLDHSLISPQNKPRTSSTNRSSSLPLSYEHFEALRDNIAVNGVLVPIMVDSQGPRRNIIDGNYRKAIAVELGYGCPEIVQEGLSDDEIPTGHEYPNRASYFGMNAGRCLARPPDFQSKLDIDISLTDFRYCGHYNNTVEITASTPTTPCTCGCPERMDVGEFAT